MALVQAFSDFRVSEILQILTRRFGTLAETQNTAVRLWRTDPAFLDTGAESWYPVDGAKWFRDPGASVASGLFKRIFYEEAKQKSPCAPFGRLASPLPVEPAGAAHRGASFRRVPALAPGARRRASDQRGLRGIRTVFEYNRIPALLILLGLFVLIAVLVGGKTGVRSLVGLAVTVAVLFGVLLPLLMRGAPTILSTFLCCAYVAAVAFLLLGGLQRKTVCAALGTIAGTALAMLFGLMAQSLCRVSGLRISDVEPLLQLRQTGTPIGLRGLLVAGVIVSSLGAVMDVAMSIASALDEVHAANPALGFRDLLRSGMNIGRDMVGTMTNTLILAFLGSGFTLILYLYTLGLSRYQLFSSAYVAIEVISSLSSSIGMILAIPITAVISSGLVSRGSKEDKA